VLKMKMMKLLEGVDVTKITGETQREIEGIAYHSKKVEKGFLFAAIRGMEFNGHQFIGDAIQRGAAAVLLEDDPGLSTGTWIRVPDSRRALARVSANFYGHPSSQIRLIGVTGTNGKTTTTYLVESILEKAGYQVGVLGTINYRYGKKVIQAVNTTPESLDLQRILGEMVRHGVSHVIMEVSSHGLDLDRVFGCQFDGAVFTNLTSDHLDYHKTLARYFESKRKLFSDHLAQSPKAGRFAVTNGDDPQGEAIVEGIPLPVIRYGLNPSCGSCRWARLTLEGLSCRIRTPQGSLMVRSKLIGSYNLYNILAAVSAGIAMNLPLQIIQAGVEAVEGVSGRFEKVENQRGIHIIVDYAHTHDALERVLAGLKKTLSNASSDPGPSRIPSGGGKIITVFGCGGDRDRTNAL
jgi:UDP-N-acetylmuramoyl-L-alanyl-D-glutamate--2,6-diaminopimelate ligase